MRRRVSAWRAALGSLWTEAMWKPDRLKQRRQRALCTEPWSMLGRSNSGERGGLEADSVPMLTRRPSFSNWSMLSWRTRPRRLPVASCATTTARWYSRTSGVGGVRAAAPPPAPRCASVRLPGDPERDPGLLASLTRPDTLQCAWTWLAAWLCYGMPLQTLDNQMIHKQSLLHAAPCTRIMHLMH